MLSTFGAKLKIALTCAELGNGSQNGKSNIFNSIHFNET